MKKLIALLLAAVILVCCAYCAFADEAGTAVSGTPSVGMPNPLSEASVKGILEAIGVELPAPDFANSASWFVINGNPRIGELRFSVGGQNYVYRVAAMNAFDDISGMYYTWTETSTARVGYNEAKVSLIRDEQGVIQWYDVVPGLMYSLSVDSGADAALLAETANAIYAPVQGDADGDVPTTGGTVYGTVIYATNSDFSLDCGGSVYAFRITSSTRVNTYSFDRGDFLCVQYIGDLGSNPAAIQIDKIPVVEPTMIPQPTQAPRPTPAPYIDPVVNPMISSTGVLTSWGDICTIITDSGQSLRLSLSANFSMPIGYFPKSGDNVSFTYNSARGELCELEYISSEAMGYDDYVAPEALGGWDYVAPEALGTGEYVAPEASGAAGFVAGEYHP